LGFLLTILSIFYLQHLDTLIAFYSVAGVVRLNLLLEETTAKVCHRVLSLGEIYFVGLYQKLFLFHLSIFSVQYFLFNVKVALFIKKHINSIIFVVFRRALFLFNRNLFFLKPKLGRIDALHLRFEDLILTWVAARIKAKRLVDRFGCLHTLIQLFQLVQVEVSQLL
jgi:hypothetical protein